MKISLKCQYALRALFALARREREGWSNVTEIAEEQAIPPRFLENILRQLRQGGFVDSRRGQGGGFFLARPARDIRVGEVIRFIEGPMHPTGWAAEPSAGRPRGHGPFERLWNEAQKALEAVYDSSTLRDLAEEDRRLASNSANDYSI
jgi:Rrf2 family protein